MAINVCHSDLFYLSFFTTFLYINLNFSAFYLNSHCFYFYSSHLKREIDHFSTLTYKQPLDSQSSMIDESSQPPNAQISDSSNSESKIPKKNTLQTVKRPSKTNEIQEKRQSLSNSSELLQQGGKAQNCINKICQKNKNNPIKPNHNKNIAFDPNELCNECMIQYKKEAYCLYCKQIYFDSSDDGKEWILCDQCGRWVHSQCANYDPTFDSDFKCIKCKKNQVQQNNLAMIKKQSIKPSQKPADRRKLAECSLNAYGFFWQLGPKQLAEDMDKIREYLN